MSPAHSVRQTSRFAPRALGSLFLAGCLLGAGLLSGGCAPATSGPKDKIDPATGEQVTYEFKRPVMKTLAPNEVSLGDEVQVFGEDFVDDKHGELSLYLEGSFTSEDGDSNRWKGTIPLTYVSPGKAKFVFGPDVFFSPSGQDLGKFEGVFQVVNKLTGPAANAEVGDVELSDAENKWMRALPSLVIDQLRSVDDNCEPVTTATTGDNNIAIGVHTIGLPAGTDANPITFRFTFTAPDVSISFVEDQPYAVWPAFLSAGASQTPAATPESGSYSVSFDVTDGNSALLDPQHLEQTVRVSPSVTISQNAVDQSVVKLGRLASGKYDKAAFTTINIAVQATRGSDTISRVVPMRVYNQLEIGQFSGTPKLKQVYDVEQADGCVAGAIPSGTDYQYSEGSSESKSRSVNMNWNTQNSRSLGVQAGIRLGAGDLISFDGNVNASSQWSQGFGVDVNESVSTETHKNATYSVHIIPNYYGFSFRQAARYERSIPVNFHNACGKSENLGTALLTDWKWNFSVNQGPSCSTPPDSKLPAAQTF